MPKIRKAKITDLPFIVNSIVESERSAGNAIAYVSAFHLDIPQFTALITNIFEEEIEGQPWCLTHWNLLVNEQDVPLAGLCCWKEAEDGLSSDLKKSQILHFFLSQSWEAAKEKLQILSSVTIPRVSGYYQLEHLYSAPEYRGKGYMKFLMEGVMNEVGEEPFEIQVLDNNIKAVSLYEYMGFSVCETKCNEELLRLSLLSGSCKLQMIKKHG